MGNTTQPPSVNQYRVLTLCGIPGIGPVTQQCLYDIAYRHPTEVWARYEFYGKTKFHEWMNEYTRIQNWHLNRLVHSLELITEYIGDPLISQSLAYLILRDNSLYNTIGYFRTTKYLRKNCIIAYDADFYELSDYAKYYIRFVMVGMFWEIRN